MQVLLLICTAVGASADKLLFREEGTIFNVQHTVHVALNMSFDAVLDMCDGFRLALRAVQDRDFQDDYRRTLWRHAAAVVRAECDFDHIWPGESLRSRTDLQHSDVQHHRDKRQVLAMLGAISVFNTVYGFFTNRKLEHYEAKMKRLEAHDKKELLILASHET